jgi:N-methylhydantoinase B
MMEIDPVTMEVVRNALFTITEEMGVSLQRSAYSSNIKTRLDYACAIFDSQLRNVVQDLKIPSLLGALVNIVPTAIREYGMENLDAGDGIFTNDPYRGGYPSTRCHHDHPSLL